jgi:hypothetical protein
MKLRYITGRGGSSESGLSKYLRTFSDDFKVLANDRSLHRRSVDEQIEIVREFSNAATHLIANSYGGYLWLLSRIDAVESASRVLLLSPLMGRHTDQTNMMTSRPPRLKGLESAIESGRIVLPGEISIYTGQADPVCDFRTAINVCAKLKITDLHILSKQNHMLDHEIVEHAVEAFVNS